MKKQTELPKSDATITADFTASISCVEKGRDSLIDHPSFVVDESCDTSRLSSTGGIFFILAFVKGLIIGRNFLSHPSFP